MVHTTSCAVEKRKYDRIYRENLRYDSGLLYGSLFHGKRVLGFLKDLPYNTLLDVGCGRGQFALSMAQLGKQVSACDISSELIDRLRLNPSVDWKCCSIDKLDFDSSAFDLVTAFDVIEHVPESLIDRSLAELVRVTRPGGSVVMSIAWHEDIKWGMQLHMTIKNRAWWFDKLSSVGRLSVIDEKPKGVFVHIACA